MELKDLTLNQYQKIVALEESDPHSAKRGYQKIAIALGIDLSKVIDMPIDKVNTMLVKINRPIDKLNVKKYIFCNGMILKATTNLIDMKPSQLIDFYQLQESGAKYNELLAVMYVPLIRGYKAKYHSKIAKSLLNKKVSKTLGLLFFWLDYSTKCEKILMAYLEEQMKVIEMQVEEILIDKEFTTS